MAENLNSRISWLCETDLPRFKEYLLCICKYEILSQNVKCVDFFPQFSNYQKIQESIDYFSKNFLDPPHLDIRIGKFLDSCNKKSVFRKKTGFCPLSLLKYREFYPCHLFQIIRNCQFPDILNLFNGPNLKNDSEFTRSLFELQTCTVFAWLNSFGIPRDRLSSAEALKQLMGPFYRDVDHHIYLPQATGSLIDEKNFGEIYPKDFIAQYSKDNAPQKINENYQLFEITVAQVIQHLMEDFAYVLFMNSVVYDPNTSILEQKKSMLRLFEQSCVSKK